MANILELKEERLNLQNELKNLISSGEAEKRELNETENNRLAEIRTSIDKIDEEIIKIEDENKKLEQKNKENKIDNKMGKEVRLFDLIKEVANGNVSDEHRDYVNGNKISFRTVINAGTATQGQENVPEEKKALDVAIRNASVLNKIGATWFSNAVGDVSIPKYSGSNVAWKGENVAADDGAGSFSETVLQPKRLTGYIDISKTFLAQDSNDAESILIQDLANAVAEKLDKTIFGADSGSTTIPAGLFSDTGYTTTGATVLSGVTYDDILELESAVEGKNGVDYIFIANPKVKFALKGTQMASALDMVYSKGEIDGYKAVVSNSVVSKGIICMDPRDLAVATWANGLEITVDTVSRAINNEVRVVINYLVDAKLRNNRIAAEIYS